MFADRKVLVVEDDQREIATIEQHLRDLRAVYRVATTLSDAKSALESETFDFILSDLHLETKAGVDRPDGLDIISLARSLQPSATIVATSSDPRSDIWAETLKAGAQNFIRKPLSKPDELVIAFGLAFERKLLTSKAEKTRKPKGRWAKYAESYPDGMILDKLTQKRIAGMARHADKTIVVMGETGTGKEEISKLIHRYRCRAGGEIPFVAVNCATVTAELTESILFGHKRGAFTGADSSTIGYISEADRGVLFLDEIQSLELRTQQKLLRVLNDGTYNRLGETKTMRSQFQLVAASTQDLDEAVEQGKFLLDLRTRMIGLDVVLKPLRDRLDEVPALIALFLDKRNLTLSDDQFEKLVAHLKRYSWPGNIRQLFKTLDAWVLTCELDEVPMTVENFPMVRNSAQRVRNSESDTAKTQQIESAKSEMIHRPLVEDRNLDESVEAYEKAIIEAALYRHHHKIGAVVNALQVPRSSLDSKRRKHGLVF